MTPYDRLYAETASARNEFLSLPLVQQGKSRGYSREQYLDFLSQTFHHVKHILPLLSLAAARTTDERYQNALLEHMKEERGHDKWLLDDIQALGGDPVRAAYGKPDEACAVMVGYAYYAVEHISPYALLGMLHVLEGLSATLSQVIAGTMRRSLQAVGKAGFFYLTSHGSLDAEHAEHFKEFVNGIEDPETVGTIIDTARIFYRLYGAIFLDLDYRHAEIAQAA